MANQDTDTRIVEMQFDAKDFDKGIRKSQKNLEDFKKSLNFEDAAKQMKSVATAVNPINSVILGMANNVKKLTQEFLGIGRLSTYIAKKVKKAWQGALNDVENFAKSMTTVQFDAGKVKYEGLLRSVQTVKNATGEAEDYVYGVMKTLNKYTDETSYDFADMANNIGKFTTAGVKLEDAEKEMEGIANWAALAGQGVQEAQRAMYNISQAMSAGSMRLVDYKSIQNANMDIREFRQQALDAAVAAGTLKKSADGVYKTVKGGKTVNLDNFTETLQFKWFDKKTMETVFKTFGDNTKGIGEKAYKAAQRCVTMTDVLNAWKDMLSTGWMKSYEHVFGQLTDAMGLFSGLCNKVGDDLGKLVEIRNGILERWSLNGGRKSLFGALFGELETPDGETLFKGAYGFLDALRDIGESIREAFWDFIGEFIDPAQKSLFNSDKEGQGMAFLAAGLTNLTQKFQEFTGKIKTFLFTAGEGETETRIDRIKHIVQAIFSAIMLVVNIVKGIGQFGAELLHQLHPAIYAVESLIDGILQMFTGAVVKGAKNNTIGNFFHRLAEILKPVTTVINVVVRALASLIAQLIVTVKKSGIIQTLSGVFQQLSLALSNIITKALNSGFLQKIFGWIQKGITMLPEFISKIKSFVQVLVSNFKGSKTYKGISDFFKKTFNAKNFKELLNNIKNIVKQISAKVPGIFSTLFSSISGGLGDAFSNIFGVGQKTEDGSKSVAENIAEAVVEPISELGQGSSVSNAVDKATPGLFANLKNKISGIWSHISEFFNTLANSEGIKKVKEFFAGTDLKTLLTGAKDILKWLAIFRTGSGLVSIGKGAKSLGKGIKVFGKNLKNLNLSDMFKNMLNINNVINSNNTNKSFNFGKLGNQLLQLAGGIYLIVLAAQSINKMNDKELIRAGETIGIVITALVTAGILAKKFAGNGGSLLGLALGVMILMIPMNMLRKTPWDDVFDGASKLAVVIAAIAGAGRIAGNVKMKGFIGLATAVTLLMIPLKILTNMPVLGKDNTFGGLTQGILALSALMLVMAGASRLAGGNKMKGMLSLAVSLTLIMIPLKMLAGMSWENLAKGIIGLATVFTGIILLVNTTKGGEIAKLSALVGAIAVLSLIAFLIGQMEWTKALTGFGSIFAIMLGMTLIFATAKKLDAAKIKQIKNIFLALTLVVGVIAAAIVVMSEMKVDWQLVASFLGGIVALVTAIGIIIPIIGKINPGTAITGILVLAAAIVAVMGAVALMLPVVLGSLGNSMLAMSAKLKTMGGLLQDFFGRLDAINEESLKHAISVFDYLRLMISNFSGFQSYEKHIHSFFSQLMYLGAALDTFLVNESKYPDNLEDTKTYKMVQKLIELSPSLVGFSVGTLPEELLYLGVGLMLFDESCKKITDTDPPALKLLQGIFGQADNIEKFTKLPLQDFSGQMSALGGAMSLYANGAAEVTGLSADGSDAPDISKSIEILKQVCSAISGDDGTGAFKIPDNMPDPFTLGYFASQLEALGKALSTFATSAKSMETDTGNAIALLQFLAEIGGYITPSNLEVVNAFDDVGHASAYGNSGKLNQFALDIAALGTALSTFATNIGGNEAQFETGLTVLSKFGDLNSRLTKDNLKFTSAFDDAQIHKTALDAFATDIGALGHSLASFAQNVIMDDGTQADFDHAINALDFMATIQNKLPELGGLHAFLHGQKETLGELSTDIQQIGDALSSFSAAVVSGEDGGKFDVSAVNDALEFLSKFITIVGVLNENVMGVDVDGGMFMSYGEAIYNMSDFIDSITNNDQLFRRGYGESSLIEDIIAFAQQVSTAFKEADDIDPNSLIIFKDMATSLASLASLDVSGTFKYPGKMIAEGIASGVESGRSRVVNAIIDIVTAAIEAGKNTAKIESPSKVFAEMGEYMDLGLVKGLTSNQNDVENASDSMVQSALQNATTLMMLVNQAMEDNVDLQPKITPVLDLTNITANGATLDQMFNNYSLNLMSALNRASAATNNGPVQVIVQNPTDLTGIQDMIIQLQGDIVGLEEAIRNMPIILDTGVVAGGVTDHVDQNLGNKNLYARRRN